MRLSKIKKVMSDCKDYIEDRMKQSSESFYEKIKDEEQDWMCEQYPDIACLSPKAFQFLWKKA